MPLESVVIGSNIRTIILDKIHPFGGKKEVDYKLNFLTNALAKAEYSSSLPQY